MLIHGGTLTAPNFAFRNLQGQFDVENVGVAPDIEVWQDPKLLRQGRDPQLKKSDCRRAGGVGESAQAPPRRARLPRLQLTPLMDSRPLADYR